MGEWKDFKINMVALRPNICLRSLGISVLMRGNSRSLRVLKRQLGLLVRVGALFVQKSEREISSFLL